MKRSQQDPASLSQIADEAGLGASDVALIAELDESTVSRLWNDPRWLDRVTGASLQRMIAAKPNALHVLLVFNAPLSGLWQWRTIS